MDAHSLGSDIPEAAIQRSLGESYLFYDENKPGNECELDEPFIFMTK